MLRSYRKRLSIIVPVYNVEPYIERCIKSLLKQDIAQSDYEIICINDGSTDNSPEIIKKMQKKFNNITLINQQNQGVSIARNNGIKIAAGDYILMVDADDYIESNSLAEKLDVLLDSYPDIGYTGHIVLDQNLRESYRFDLKIGSDIIYKGIEFINSQIRSKSNLLAPHGSWGIFIRKEYLIHNKLQYLEHVPFLEDGEFLARITCLAKTLIFISKPFYYNIKREGSATSSGLYFSEYARMGFLKAANNLLNFKNTQCKNQEQKIFMNQAIIQFTIVYLISNKGFNYIKKYYKLYNNLKIGPLKILDTKGSNDFYSKMGKAYNCSIHCFYLVWYMHNFNKSLNIRVKRFLG